MGRPDQSRTRAVSLSAIGTFALTVGSGTSASELPEGAP